MLKLTAPQSDKKALEISVTKCQEEFVSSKRIVFRIFARTSLV